MLKTKVCLLYSLKICSSYKCENCAIISTSWFQNIYMSCSIFQSSSKRIFTLDGKCRWLPLLLFNTCFLFKSLKGKNAVPIFPQHRAGGMATILVRTRLCFGPNLSPMIEIGLTNFSKIWLGPVHMSSYVPATLMHAVRAHVFY